VRFSTLARHFVQFSTLARENEDDRGLGGLRLDLRGHPPVCINDLLILMALFWRVSKWPHFFADSKGFAAWCIRFTTLFVLRDENRTKMPQRDGLRPASVSIECFT
jgi:hypothetical protein